MDLLVHLYVFGTMLALGTGAWVMSLFLRDVSIVDSFWSLLFLAGALVYMLMAGTDAARGTIVLTLLAAWALRLCVYLTWRNWGEPEDRRYRAIRARYQPGFAFKSLVIIFLFQSLLAWVIAAPLWPTLGSVAPIRLLDFAALLLWCGGMFLETVADWQLARFQADPGNKGRVLDTGLWRYSRHPNYFGECLIWWGFYLFAAGSGGWWTLFSPVLMTWLLLRFSGVVLLEETMAERRPAYRAYIERTNAFLPGPPRTDISASPAGSGK